MNVMITGDSHTAALKLGLDQLMQDDVDALKGCQVDFMPLGVGGKLIQPFFIDRGDFADLAMNPKVKRGKRLPVSSENGVSYNYYAICGLLHTIRIWRSKKYWEDFTPLTPSGSQHPVSTHLLKHIVMEDQKYLIELVKLLQRLGCRPIAIETPKPFKHNPRVQAKPELIAYVDNFYRETIKTILTAVNVPIIAVPDFCYDASGFMEDCYRHPNPLDGYHGNSEFGTIMLKELVKFITGGDRAAFSQ